MSDTHNPSSSSTFILNIIQEIGFSDLSLTPMEFTLYWHLLKFLKSPNGCFQENKTIARILNVSDKTIRNTKKSLSQKIPLKIVKNWKSTNIDENKKEKTSDQIFILPFNDPNSLNIAIENYFTNNPLKKGTEAEMESEILKRNSELEILRRNSELLFKTYLTLRKNLPNPPVKFTEPLRKNLPSNDLTFNYTKHNDDNTAEPSSSKQENREPNPNPNTKSKSLSLKEGVDNLSPSHSSNSEDNMKESNMSTQTDQPSNETNNVYTLPVPDKKIAPKPSNDSYESTVISILRPRMEFPVENKNHYYDWRFATDLNIPFKVLDQAVIWMSKNHVMLKTQDMSTKELFQTKVQNIVNRMIQEDLDRLERNKMFIPPTEEERINREAKFSKLKSIFG